VRVLCASTQHRITEHRYIYLGRAQLIDKRNLDISGILNVAQQWQLKGTVTRASYRNPGLTLQCAEYLLLHTRASNAVESYLCARDYELAAVQPLAQSVVLSNLQTAVADERWPRLCAKSEHVRALFANGPIHEAFYIALYEGRLPSVSTGYGSRTAHGRNSTTHPRSSGRGRRRAAGTGTVD